MTSSIYVHIYVIVRVSVFQSVNSRRVTDDTMRSYKSKYTIFSSFNETLMR